MSSDYTHQVLIEDLQIDAVIGVYEWERGINQPLVVSVTIDTDFSKAAATDRVDETLDYKEICQHITNLCKTTKAQLLERLAELIASMILNDFAASKVEVVVRKPTAIAKASSVGVRVVRTKR